jgi:glycosyltransferase involved in cell wall biosynthesis
MPILNRTEGERPALHLGRAEGRGLGRLSSRGGNRRVLFVQATNPGAYPPLIHASTLMADAGWEVTFLSAPIAGNWLAMPSHPGVTVCAVGARPSHVISKLNYAVYATAAARLALRLRPDVVYASDPLGAGPGLLAARLARASVVYHEHDSPSPGMLHPILARWRAAAARAARLIVFPNEERAHFAQSELRFSNNRLHIVWNVPRRAELVASVAPAEPPLIVYYHGSITPERLPETVAFAVRQMAGRVRLRIAGYEAPSARGYVRHLVGSDADAAADALIEYIGLPSRADLLAEAARAHVGLALMPCHLSDLNMRFMTGASNKPFDYMAAGLSLLVSDLPDWKTMFVDPGFGLACDPTDADSLSMALGWFIDHPEERRAMAARARNKIEAEWNYDTQFCDVLKFLESTWSKNFGIK